MAADSKFNEPSYDEQIFNEDLRDVHLAYDYDAEDAHGNPEKWHYELWFPYKDRCVYKIHGGPMAGRNNFQTCRFQCIRPHELWQCNWLEETGTIVSLVYDIKDKRITTMLGFSKGKWSRIDALHRWLKLTSTGHWENAEAAHGDKRRPDDFEKWRRLADIGNQTDRFVLSEQAQNVESFKGKGNLSPIEQAWPTI